MAKIIFLVSFTLQFLSPFTSFRLIHGATITCSQTPYPELCEPFGTNETRQTLHQTLRLAKAHSERALGLISAMNLSSFEERARLAHADCLELYKDTVPHIHRCIGSTSPNDVQTLLSATVTNLQTCEDGFVGFKLSNHLKSFPLILSNFSNLLSNSLALNKAIISQKIFDTPEESRGRTLDSIGERQKAHYNRITLR